MNPNDIDPTSPAFFFLLVLGTIFAYGFAPEIAPAAVILCFLWVLGTHPVIAIALAVAWCIRWLVVDFFFAFIAGLGGGLGLRASVPTLN